MYEGGKHLYCSRRPATVGLFKWTAYIVQNGSTLPPAAMSSFVDPGCRGMKSVMS